MTQRIVHFQVDTSGIRSYIRAARRDLVSAGKSGKLGFTVVNTAFDPDTGEFIYKYVNEGRGEVVAKNAKRLAFKVAPDTTRFALRVKPSKPARITDRAIRKLRTQVPTIIKQAILPALASNRLFDRAVLEDALERIKIAAVVAFRKATFEKTKNYNTGFTFYQREDKTPLANSFEIRE